MSGQPLPNVKVRPLKDPVILYVDRSGESDRAKKLLEKAGITPFVTEGSVEPLQRKPLVVYGGGVYQGFQEILSLLRLLQFWSGQPMRRDIFADESA